MNNNNEVSIENIEVYGGVIMSILEAMKSHKDLGLEYLANNDVTDIQLDKFYKLSTLIFVFDEIKEELGDKTLFSIGKSILDNAQMPPGMDSIDKGLSMLEIAYHMNHRVDGKVLVDPSTGIISERIGNYTYQNTGPKSGLITCQNPYPCEFDRGIITAMARKFEPLADVVLDTTKECRNTGGASSTYIASW